jgi:PAS domain S-box-containing protein
VNVPPDLARRVLDAIGDAVVVLDTKGRIVYWTGSAEEVYGRSADEVRGRRAATVFPELSRLDPEELVSLGGAERLDVVIRMGRTRSLVAATGTAVRDDHGRLLGSAVLARPMGGWLDPAERSGRPRRQWHRTLGRLVREVLDMARRDPASLDRSDALAPLLVSGAGDLLPQAECVLAVVVEERQELQVLAGAGEWAERLVGRRWPLGGTLAGRVLRERRSRETPRLQEVTSAREVLAEGGIVAGRLVPLLSERPLPDGRQVLGVLGFFRRTRSYFTPYERRLIDEFAHLVSLTLQRSELLRGFEELTERLRVGVDVAVELARSLETEQVVAGLVERAAKAARADRVLLLEVEGSRGLVLNGWDGDGRPVPRGLELALSDLVSESEPALVVALRERRCRTCGPFALRGGDGLGGEELRHAALLPLVLGGEAHGVLVVGRRRDEAFRHDDVLTLQMVGNVAALAIRNARLYRQAQEANRTRSEFLAMAGHELRTPLTLIKGYLSMLADGSLGEVPAGLRQPVELLASKAEDLGCLVDDLLFTARLESGHLPVRAMRLDLGIAARQAVRRAQARADLLGATLELELEEGVLTVSADPEHIGRILDNLVNNALTYRQPDTPAWVRVRAGVEADTVVVSVEDRGRGIPPDKQERIFERFVRGEEAAGSSGTGLGLYISRQLAARHGGKLQLDWSAPGQGSRFSLRLPRVAR